MSNWLVVMRSPDAVWHSVDHSALGSITHALVVGRLLHTFGWITCIRSQSRWSICGVVPVELRILKRVQSGQARLGKL